MGAIGHRAMFTKDNFTVPGYLGVKATLGGRLFVKQQAL
jgi:hypothetical protein